MGEAAENSRQTRLAELRHYLAKAEGFGPAGAVLPFAMPAIDAALPWRGLPRGALHEVENAGTTGEDGAAATFLAGILARLTPERPVLWCLQHLDLHPPGLALAGLAAKRLLLVQAPNEREILWAMEEGLRSGALAAVLGEIAVLPPTAGRRLQLAAEASGVTALVLRRWRSFALAERQRPAPSVAVTRWRVAAAASRDTGEPGVGAPLWQVDLLRCRGGSPASWLMEEGDATGHVAVSAELADRPAGAAATRRRAG
jgi:protein ImuA